MKPVVVLVSVLAVAAVATLLLIGGGDAPDDVEADRAPEPVETPTESVVAAAESAPLSARPTTAVEREEVVLTEDGDVADLPPEALLTAALSVRVEDEFGRPIAGADVSLAAGFPGTNQVPVPFVDFVAEESSDPRGIVSFRVPPVGIYTVLAACEGFAPGELGPIVPGDDVTLVLEPGSVVAGTVVEAESGGGVEGAVVRLERRGDVFESETGPQGEFEIADLAGGTYTLRVLAVGFDLLSKGAVAVPNDDGPLALTLTPGVAVAGVVVVRGSDQPVPGAEVVIESDDGALMPETATVTGDDGTFRFDGPVSRRGLELLVIAPGHAPERRPLKGRDDEAQIDVRVELWRGSTIAGSVLTTDGVAAADVRVRLRGVKGSRLEARTDADGAFEFVDVRAGKRLSLVVDDVPTGFAPVRIEAEPPDEGEDLLDWEVVLARGGRLDGEVRDTAGAPVAHARVTVEGLDGETWKLLAQKPVLFTDDAGRFSLPGLPEALLEVSAAHQEWLAPATVVAVVPGGEHVVTLVLDEGAVLAGLVVDTRGAPIDDALVTAHAVQEGFAAPSAEDVKRALGRASRGGRSNSSRSAQRRPAERILRAATGDRQERLTGFRAIARTDDQGRFVLKGLREGEALALVVRKEGYVPRHEFGVDPARGAPRIVLPALVTLTGRVVDATTRRPLESFQIHAEPVTAVAGDAPVGALLAAPKALRRGFRSDEGAFEFVGLQPGPWSISVAAKQHRRSTPVRVELAPGQSGDVLLEAMPAAIVRARVLAVGGEPVVGVPVSLRAKQKSGRPLRRSTDGEGVATFFDPPIGDHELLVGVTRAPIVGPVAVTVREGDQVVRELRTDGVGALVIDVRSGSGFGIPRARVRLRGAESGLKRSARADARGVARLEGLLPESVSVTVFAKGHESIEKTVTIRSGSSQDLTVHLSEKP